MVSNPLAQYVVYYIEYMFYMARALCVFAVVIMGLTSVVLIVLHRKR